jgi:glutamate synthase domain-containing protein 1
MSEMEMPGQQTAEPVQITLNDVASVVQMIDVVSRRGGIQGNEMAGVGMLRNKLEMFLQQNMPEQQAPQDAEVDVDVPPQGPLADKVVQ